jgi:hypothetical protein
MAFASSSREIRAAGQIESAVLNRISVPLDGGTAKSSGITLKDGDRRLGMILRRYLMRMDRDEGVVL